MIAADAKPTIIDVRSEKEYAGGHIDGSLNIPVNHLADRVSKLSKTGTVIVHCEGGYRSAIAAGILMNAGFENVIDLVGGYKAWVASQTPVNAG
jgi:rhodanese-related sulfurtransferase